MTRGELIERTIAPSHEDRDVTKRCIRYIITGGHCKIFTTVAVQVANGN